jgi:hypothetical protein
MPDNLPRSVQVRAPARLLPETEEATQWTPYFLAVARPYYGGHDELSREGRGLMHVPQADLYDASPNPWPANGQFGSPNGIGLLLAPILRLRPHTSAHPGATMPAVPGPTMLFRAPPPYGTQTRPIPAVGV